MKSKKIIALKRHFNKTTSMCSVLNVEDNIVNCHSLKPTSTIEHDMAFDILEVSITLKIAKLISFYIKFACFVL